ncbi:MAG: carboxypeptidase-like regulatory domain-containing protein, partial [Saprospiraceae bacterium]|nr:carboxypeptidase-like regulatory domain-containing protein [Saprospiraceae bacterium]
MKNLVVTLALACLSTFAAAQNFTLSGTITDDITGEPLIGATITANEKGTVTDFDGTFSLELPAGDYEITYSYVGYTAKSANITMDKNQRVEIGLEGMVLNEVVVVADIAKERETPVAFSTIPSIKLKEELASQDLPMILNSTPGAYATQTGGGDGDARVTIRGFNQRNVAVMVDGVPVNDMENGWVYWSN